MLYTKVQILTCRGRAAGEKKDVWVPQSWFYSVYLLYWYKSTNTDAEGAASWSRPVRKRLMAASKMKSAGQMLGLLAGLKVC